MRIQLLLPSSGIGQRVRRVGSISALLLGVTFSGFAKEPAQQPESLLAETPSRKVDLNELFNEPYYGIYLTLRSYTALLEGTALPEPLLASYLSFRPLIPVPLGETGLFLRPSLSLVRAPIADPEPGDAYAWGLGDTALFTAWVPFPGQAVLWGLGPTFIFPTATHEQFGSQHFQVGPAGGGYVYPGRWVFGLIAQQWWSVGGDPPKVSRFDLQYQITRTFPDGWQVGTSPDIFIDWKAPEGEGLTLPVGLGVYKVLPFENVPVQVGFEVLYSVIRPTLIGETWVFRFEVTPLWLLRERDG